MGAEGDLTANDAHVSDLIANFIREWTTPLDKLAQEIFFHEEFRRALAAGNVEYFLNRHDLVEECLAKVNIPREKVPFYGDSTYPVLRVLFEPLFKDLLMKGTSLLWGGINYWDTLANTFYTEQFTRLDAHSPDQHIFQEAMKWELSERSHHLLLPLTTFIFEDCKPPRQAGVFAKNEPLHALTSPAERDFYDLRGVVNMAQLKDKPRIRSAISQSDGPAADKILNEYFTARRSPISVTCDPPEGISLEDDNKRRLSNLFELFELITPDPGWKRLYYISARLKPNAKVAGLLLTAEGDIDQTLIAFVQFFISRISSFIEYVISSYEMRRHAIRSALAAIMGRNMSHNIGSHVLARISTPQTISEAVYGEGFLKEVQPFVIDRHEPPSLGGMLLSKSPTKTPSRGKKQPPSQINLGVVKTQITVSTMFISQLNAYLRMRMDFVADIATALRPPSPMRVSFLGEVLLPFTRQLLLWKHLCGSQNLTDRDIIFHMRADGASTSARAGRDPDSNLNTALATIAVGIPNGALGCQAFYSIVENFVRNTVKHSKETKRRKLQVFFDMVLDGPETLFDDFFKVTISDDWGGCLGDKTLVRRLNELLSGSLINESGSLLSTNRGLKEMKAAASYLRGLLPESLEDPELKPPLLKAVDSNGNLSYEFYMLKPKELFVLSCDKSGDFAQPRFPEHKRQALRKQGVEIATSTKDTLEKAPPYSMLFIISAETPDVERLRDSFAELPVRVLIQWKTHVEALYGTYRRRLPIEQVQKLLNDFMTSLRDGQGVRAATDARELWMRLICHEPQTELWVDENVKHGEWNVPGLSRLVSKADKPGSDSQIILYARHGFKHRANNVAFYEPYSGGGVDPISFILENPPQALEARRSLVYQLIETGALPVIILDERIQEAAETVTRTFSSDLNEGEPQKLTYWLRLMRVYVPEKAALNLESKALTCEQITDWIRNTIGQCRVGCNIPPMLVIHQGILDGIGLRDARDAQAWINSLKKPREVSDIFVTSGRGIPDNIPPDTRFVPLSTIALYTVERKSKFHLVKALLAARRARSGGPK